MKASIKRVTMDLGPWIRRRDEYTATPEPSPTAPHKRIPSLSWLDPANQLEVIWVDEAHTMPFRIVDGDGCSAAVLGRSE